MCPYLCFDRYSSKSSLKAALETIVYNDGNTNTSGALRTARQDVYTDDAGDRPGITNVVILITDGQSTREVDRTFIEADQLKAENGSNALVFVVGITENVLEDELRKISSDPQRIDETYFTTPDFDKLQNVILTLVNRTCSSIQTTPAPATTTTRPPVRGKNPPPP